MENPDNKSMTICVAKAIRKLMVADAGKKSVFVQVFELTPEERAYLKPRGLGFPSLQEMQKFLTDLFRDAQLAPECNCIAFILLQRIINATHITVTESNWRPLIFACYLLSSKMYDDLSMINRDFSVVCPLFTVQRVNALELAVLDILQFNICVNGSEYADAYFHLQSLLTVPSFPAPLRKHQAEKIEVSPYPVSFAGPAPKPVPLTRHVTCNEDDFLNHAFAVLN